MFKESQQEPIIMETCYMSIDISFQNRSYNINYASLQKGINSYVNDMGIFH